MLTKVQVARWVPQWTRSTESTCDEPAVRMRSAFEHGRLSPSNSKHLLQQTQEQHVLNTGISVNSTGLRVVFLHWVLSPNQQVVSLRRDINFPRNKPPAFSSRKYPSYPLIEAHVRTISGCLEDISVILTKSTGCLKPVRVLANRVGGCVPLYLRLLALPFPFSSPHFFNCFSIIYSNKLKKKNWFPVIGF